MSNTYSEVYIHVVFSTKNRDRVLFEERRKDLYSYIWGIHKNLNCHVYRIGGVEDHVHILTSMPMTISVADYVKEVKTGSSKWIKAENVFPDFVGWQDGYGAFSVSKEDVPALTEYIANQPEHHRTVSFSDEYKRLLCEAGISYDERYL